MQSICMLKLIKAHYALWNSTETPLHFDPIHRLLEKHVDITITKSSKMKFRCSQILLKTPCVFEVLWRYRFANDANLMHHHKILWLLVKLLPSDRNTLKVKINTFRNVWFLIDYYLIHLCELTNPHTYGKQTI